MEKKIILVTGANRGIGFETVRQLALMNNTVILTSRNRSAGEKAVNLLAIDKIHVNYIPLDVSKPEQRIKAKEIVVSEFGKLDVLINNAGIRVNGDNSLKAPDSKIWAETMATNAEAPLELSKIFAPIMPRGSHIINVSSSGGSMTEIVGGWSPVYCISKTTLNAITRHLAYHFETLGICVNAACPGWVKTGLGTESAPGNVQQGADTIVWLASGSRNETGKFWKKRKEIPW